MCGGWGYGVWERQRQDMGEVCVERMGTQGMGDVVTASGYPRDTVFQALENYKTDKSVSEMQMRDKSMTAGELKLVVSTTRLNTTCIKTQRARENFGEKMPDRNFLIRPR